MIMAIQAPIRGSALLTSFVRTGGILSLGRLVVQRLLGMLSERCRYNQLLSQLMVLTL